MVFSPQQAIIGLGDPMGDLVQTVLTDIFPTLLVLEKEIGSGYFGQKDVEVIIVDLNPSYGIKIRFNIRRAFRQKGPVAL